MLLASVGLYAGQDLLLHYLAMEDGQTVSALVDKMCNQHSTLFNMLDRMAAAGMVVKEKDADDKRTSRIYMTDKGREAYKNVMQTWQTLEADAVTGFTKQEEAVLRKLLQQVHNNLT